MQKKAQLFTSKEDFINQYREECESLLSKKYDELQPQERYYVLASLIASKAKNFKVDAKKGDKSVYYFSLEFLIGPLLDNYLLNFGVRDIVKEGCAEHRVSVVLQHDIKDYSVAAVESVLQWGLNNGYSFKALQLDSPTAHHGVNN